MDLAEVGVFIATWTAVTVRSGMRDVTKTSQRMRLNGSTAKKKWDSLTKGEGEGT